MDYEQAIKILELGRGAEAEEFKPAYRRLAKIRHPDRNAGSPTAAKDFRLLTEAYDFLQNHPEPPVAPPVLFKPTVSRVNVKRPASSAEAIKAIVEATPPEHRWKVQVAFGMAALAVIALDR